MPWDISAAGFNPEYGVKYDWGNGIDELANGITLYYAGCRYGNIHNCTLACLDAQKLWNDENSAYTLHNCNAYSVVAQLWHAGNLTDHGIEIATSFGISNDSSASLFSAPAGIMSCISAYCEYHGNSTEWCNGTGSDAVLASFQINNDTWQDFYFDYDAGLCNDLDAAVNPDIGGIGVFASYIMQVAIVAIAWLLFHIGHDWIFYSTYLFTRVRKSVESPVATARHTQGRVKEIKMFQALTRALTEFQKAQVWLMLAVQVASLIALNNQQYFDASTWQQQRNNLGIFFDLALGGCPPVLLIELALREAHKLETYIFIISTFCVALSASTWFVTSKILNGYSPQNLTHEGPSACAGLVPMSVCYEDDWFYKSGATTKGTGRAIVIFSLVAQAYIILDRLRVWSHDKHGSRRNSFEIVRDKVFNGAERDDETENTITPRNRWAILRSGTARKTAHFLGKFIIVAAEIVLFYLTLRQLKDYARIFGAGNVNDYVAINKKSWQLGQIIAVVIFVPPVVEYLWDCYRGVAKTVQQRMLPDSMVIVRKQDVGPGIDTPVARTDSDLLDASKSRVFANTHVYRPVHQSGKTGR